MGQASENRQAIEGRFSTVSMVKSAGVEVSAAARIKYHPNDETHEKMQEQIKLLTVSVLKAWQEHFDQQGERIFVWPDDLSSNFLKEIARITTVDKKGQPGKKERIPIEKVIPYEAPQNHENNLNINDRTTYGLFIKDELPKLAERIQSNWEQASADGSKPIVMWNPANQTHLRTTRFDWSAQEDKAPTTIQILYAQEDLRVLEALMDIIARTNFDATADYDATIKSIEFIHLGRDAARRAGKIMKLGDNAAPIERDAFGGTSGGGDDGGDDSSADDAAADDGDVDGDTDGGDEGGGGGAAPISTSGDPADFRYVDHNYSPLSANKLRESFDKKDPELARLAVAKRLPVRMRMTIDQRKIDRLLAACGNSPLMVEVRQVRINPAAAGGGASSSSSSFGGGGFGGFGGGGGGGGDDGDTADDDAADDTGDDSSGGGSAPAANPSGRNKNNQFDLVIEIYGIVYIYNPVDDSKFDASATAEAGEAEEIDDTAGSDTTPAP